MKFRTGQRLGESLVGKFLEASLVQKVSDSGLLPVMKKQGEKQQYRLEI
jgi:hypothetical protein